MSAILIEENRRLTIENEQLKAQIAGLETDIHNMEWRHALYLVAVDNLYDEAAKHNMKRNTRETYRREIASSQGGD